MAIPIGASNVALGPRPPTACVPGCAFARHRRDDSKAYFANAVVTLIRNVQVIGVIEGNTGRSTEFRTGGHPAIASESGCSVPSYRRDYTCSGSHLADTIVESIRNIDVARFIEGKTRGGIQLSAGCRGAIAHEAGSSVPSYRRDHAGSDRDFADSVVGVVRDVEVTCTVEWQIGGGIHCSAGCCTAIARVACCPITRDCRDHVGRHCHLADAVIRLVRDVYVACVVDSNAG